MFNCQQKDNRRHCESGKRDVQKTRPPQYMKQYQVNGYEPNGQNENPCSGRYLAWHLRFLVLQEMLQAIILPEEL